MNFLDYGFEGKRDVWTYTRTIAFIFSTYIFGSLFLVLDWELFFAENYPDLLINDASVPEIMGKSRYLFWLLFPFLLTGLALAFSISKFHERKVLSLFTSRESFDFKRYLIGFIVGVIFILPLLVFEIFQNKNLVWQFELSKFIVLLLVSILFIPVQTLVEELIFRALAMQGIKARTGSNRAAIIISSMLFASMHFSNPEVDFLGYGILPYYFIMGAFFALITYWDKGVELSSGYHAANNLVTALFVTSSWQAFQTDALYLDTSQPTFSWWIYLQLVILLPLVAIVLQRIFKWNWKVEL